MRWSSHGGRARDNACGNACRTRNTRAEVIALFGDVGQEPITWAPVLRNYLWIWVTYPSEIFSQILKKKNCSPRELLLSFAVAPHVAIRFHSAFEKSLSCPSRDFLVIILCLSAVYRQLCPFFSLETYHVEFLLPDEFEFSTICRLICE